MIYSDLYNEIINDALKRGLDKKKLEGYFERHHIIPRCMGGTNDKSNLVLLTAREHYICHKDLYLNNQDNNMLFYAWFMMSKTKNSKKEILK